MDAKVERRIVVREPSSGPTEMSRDAAIGLLRAKILDPDPRYWLQGSGDVSIEFHSRLVKSELSIMYREGVGFLANYVNKKLKDKPLFVSLADREFRDRVSLFVGGDFFLFWKSHFLPAAVVSNAVQEFLIDGLMPASSRWIAYAEVPSSPDGQINGEPYQT